MKEAWNELKYTAIGLFVLAAPVILLACGGLIFVGLFYGVGRIG